MTSIQRAIFPAILFSGLILILLTRLISNPQLELQAAALGASPATPLLSGMIEVLIPAPAEEPAALEENKEEENHETPPPAEEVNDENQAGCSLSPAYPASILQWCEPIMSQAAYHGVDANLIAAVMLQESGGSADAYSKSGAVGLMQVMPRDGIAANFMCKNGPCFANRPSMDELFDPHFNIEYGARMLSGLIQRTGDVREALLAYGPMDMGYRYADIVLNIYNNYQ